MIKKLANQLVFLILLLVPSSFAYTFGDSNINVTMFTSLAAQSLSSSKLNLSYTVSWAVYNKEDNSLNLTLPPISLYAITESATTILAGGSAGSGSSSSPERAVELVYPMRIRDSIRLNIKGARHDLTLDDLDLKNNIASYTLASNNPKPFSLRVGESAFFDTDDNGINDLNLTLRDINFRRATTVIREMIEVQPIASSVLPSLSDVTGQVVRQEETTTSILQQVVREEKKFNSKAVVIGAIIAVIFIIALIVLSGIKNKKVKAGRNRV